MHLLVGQVSVIVESFYLAHIYSVFQVRQFAQEMFPLPLIKLTDVYPRSEKWGHSRVSPESVQCHYKDKS